MNEASRSDARAAGFAVDPEVAEALRAQGAHGERALALLQDAARVLSAPEGFSAPYEVAQSCCRGALDSLLKMAGERFPGVRSATAGVSVAAKTLIQGWREAGEAAAGDVEELGRAVDQLIAEESVRGGFRLRQVDHLVRQRAREGLGAAERYAANESWNGLYADASAVLHGGGAAAQTSADLFRRIIEAVRQVFVALPTRAVRLRELAESLAPTQLEADEVALMTDPRAGAYFLRAATDEAWLKLLPVERLAPEPTGWPARPYLARQLEADSARTIEWLTDCLPYLRTVGPAAVAQAVGLVIHSGIAAAPLLKRIFKDGLADSDVLLPMAWWAQAVPGPEQNRVWAGLVQDIVADVRFVAREPWEAAQLLEALVSAAYPDPPAPAPDAKLVVGLRHVLAGALDRYADPDRPASALAVASDLSAIRMDLPHRFVLHAARAVLDLAQQDADHGVGLQDRLSPLRRGVRDGRAADRVAAVHLWETRGLPGGDDPESWWAAAIETAEAVVAGGSHHADIARFLQHLVDHCPPETQAQLLAALTRGIGPAPDTDQIAAWRQSGAPLPTAWLSAWLLAKVLPAPVLEPWQPLMSTLAETAAGQQPDAPSAPASVVDGGQPSPVPVAQFAAQASAAGAPAAMAALAEALTEGQDSADPPTEQAVRHLVEADPQTWSRDPAAVATAAPTALQAAYFEAIDDAIESGSLDRVQAGAAPAVAAYTAARDATSAQSSGLQAAACALLHNAWIAGVDLAEAEDPAVRWLAGLVAAWVQPRSATRADPVFEALDDVGGRALAALIAWGADRARRTGGHLPEPLAGILDRVLEAWQDALALAVIGRYLTALFRNAPGWADEYADRLLAADRPDAPVHSWFVHGVRDRVVLARLDRRWLLGSAASLDDELHSEHVVAALLDQSDPLGPAPEALSLLAGGRGTAAVSRVLAALAVHLRSPAADARRVCDIWQGALDAGLPDAALAGAGTFALVAELDDQRWLELTAATLEQTTVLHFPDRIARRAAGHPGSPQALRIAAAVLATPTDAARREIIKSEAYRLLAASSGPAPEHQALREALINAGVVEAAFTAADRPEPAIGPTEPE